MWRDKGRKTRDKRSLNSERTPPVKAGISIGPSNCCQLTQRGALPCCNGLTKGGLNSTQHAVCDGTSKPVCLLLSERQMSDYTGARCLLSALPNACKLIANRGYDADWFIAALKKKGITPCILQRKNRTTRRHHSKQLYKQRYKMEIMFSHIKDWRRMALYYDRCAHTFFSAICIAATVIFYLKERVLSLVV